MNAPVGPSTLDLPQLRLGLSNASLARILRSAFAVALGLAGLYLCYRLAAPFFTPITAAFILAILFSPLHRWVSQRIRPASVAALVSVMTVASVVMAVAALLVAQIMEEAAEGALLVRSAFEDGLIRQLLSEHPKFALLVQGVLDQVKAADLAANGASWLTDMSATMLRGSMLQLAGALLTFFLLFYFLRDRTDAAATLRSVLPFTDEETKILFGRIVDTVHATVFGMMITGTILGVLGGVIFAAVGLPAPFLWGLIMAVFAILPVLGIGMIWIPAAAWLALNAQWPEAVGLTAGFLCLTAADGVIYPYLVGNRLRLNTAVAFVAAIGGLIVFGPVGFILGPMVITLMLTLRDVLCMRLKAREATAAQPSPPAR